MSIIVAIILGLLQGLSEFIPISSTAHLTIAGKLLGLIDPNHPEQWTSFIAVIQLGTLVAVLLYFSKEIREIPSAFLRENLSSARKPLQVQSLNSRMGWFIIIGTIPIVTIGLVLKKVIESNITKDLLVIAIALIVLAIILALAEKIAKFNKEIDNVNWKDALIVGLAQCLALFPGASRSGTTLTAGLFLGMKRESAARFSFLLSIPAVLASGLLEFYQSLEYLNGSDLVNIIVATIAAAVSGYFSIAFLLRFLRTRSTLLFVVYRIILGASIIVMVWTNFIQ
ncbi:MAG: undecaprenyl-diphosphatase UppP [Ignavibacteria bacterium GWB2_35_12]|nr:MAG: undecaprenyl-diphosphatase UppP [Ignavibacteria bacterium GWA2_35_8]OGU41285.1 MAG: undecaprenyl-diphosphatase UppP [Ignavibacteria bacterium GWB2_35_12]OGU94764.1 MAG: undecaprenyl-diphosphatase UppP [Ignavibacteria bacterium RIFOXYA2_FULL_35_10]OGV23930.1 MAG: undecaprenyl-diphosphatase UppP [Ignavibacteria bacterium RIFOXYC2_FULL_35_21]